MQGLQEVPAWVPEAMRDAWEETGDPFVAGLLGSFGWYTSQHSPFGFMLDDAGVAQLLKLTGVELEDLGPV